MRLRRLELKDAFLMLEWMHDENVICNMATNFEEKSIEDINAFILNSRDESTSLHRAIVSESDEYMGTVSLKHIDMVEKIAEFAIVVRTEAMSKGYSWFGMIEILRIAFEELHLESVYWCVSKDNSRAVHFYDKHRFREALDIPVNILDNYRNEDNLKWYSVLCGDDYTGEFINRNSVAGCKIVSIKTIPTVNAGELSFFEATHDFSFEIKRIYYISKVPEGVRRGFHAHKNLKQLLFCPYGKIQLVLDDGHTREEIILSDPSIGVLIDKPIWREMLWLESNSVLCVAASEYYDVDDYIRDYKDFKSFIGE